MRRGRGLWLLSRPADDQRLKMPIFFSYLATIACQTATSPGPGNSLWPSHTLKFENGGRRWKSVLPPPPPPEGTYQSLRNIRTEVRVVPGVHPEHRLSHFLSELSAGGSNGQRRTVLVWTSYRRPPRPPTKFMYADTTFSFRLASAMVAMLPAD